MNLSPEQERYQALFDAYTKPFLCISDEKAYNYQMKYDHTLRVRKQATALSLYEKFSSDLAHALWVAALFHDIGRFKQYFQYQTFQDRVTGSHAQMSVDILKEKEILQEEVFQKEIEDAILYHSYYALPTGLNELTIKIARAIRDADKLDGYYVMLKEKNRYDLPVLNPEKPYSESVYEAIMHDSCVNFKDLQYGHDRDLAMVGLVFDLNYDYSFDYIQKQRYIEMMFEKMPQTKPFQKMQQRVLGFIKDRKVK